VTFNEATRSRALSTALARQPDASTAENTES